MQQNIGTRFATTKSLIFIDINIDCIMNDQLFLAYTFSLASIFETVCICNVYQFPSG